MTPEQEIQALRAELARERAAREQSQRLAQELAEALAAAERRAELEAQRRAEVERAEESRRTANRERVQRQRAARRDAQCQHSAGTTKAHPSFSSPPLDGPPLSSPDPISPLPFIPSPPLPPHSGLASARPPDAQLSHTATQVDPQHRTESESTRGDIPEADPADVLDANPSEIPNRSNYPARPDSSPHLALVAQEGPQEPRQRTKPAAPAPEDLQALWNELAPPKGLGRWERMSDNRKRAARLSLEAVPDLGKWRAWLTAELSRGWNLGQNDTEWKADVDWLLRVKTRDLVADFNPAQAGPRRQHNLPIPAGTKPPVEQYAPGRPKLPTLEEARKLGMVK